jgi:hypothetical protein
MDHVVTLDSEAHEIENLLNGTKSMIIHCADFICNPYGMVNNGDMIYLVYNNTGEAVKAKAVVSSVYNSYKLTVPESFEMIIRNQDKLILPDELFYKYAGKKYIVLVGLKDVEKVDPFSMVRSDLTYANDWCPIHSSSVTAK